jgi:hypothetical protein
MVRHRALAIGVSLVIGSSEENINDMVTSSKSKQNKAPRIWSLEGIWHSWS